MKVAFLDRDGTIIKDYPDEVWGNVSAPEFFPDTIQALTVLLRKGYQIILITNQYLIGEGFITHHQYAQFAQLIIDALQEQHIPILDVFYCPHSRASGCDCCKPETGLIEQATEKYSDIDMSQSFLAGDSAADAQLAQKVQIPFYQVDYETRPNSALLSITNSPAII